MNGKIITKAKKKRTWKKIPSPRYMLVTKMARTLSIGSKCKYWKLHTARLFHSLRFERQFRTDSDAAIQSKWDWANNRFKHPITWQLAYCIRVSHIVKCVCVPFFSCKVRSCSLSLTLVFYAHFRAHSLHVNCIPVFLIANCVCVCVGCMFGNEMKFVIVWMKKNLLRHGTHGYVPRMIWMR